jgi:hypothetical protein
MAGKAIVARLQLDSKDYDKKLSEAKKKTRDFSKGGGADIAALAGKFKTVAGAIAASKAAMETFNAVIKSSQTIGDAYTRTLESAKGAVNEFVYAMANADFSGFNGGLKGILQNAKEAATAMDSLGNAQISFDYLTAGYRSDFKTSMGTAKDKSLGLGERQAAFAAAQASLDKIGEAVQVYSDKAMAAVVANAAAKGNNINRDFITRENIDRVFALDLSANGDAEKAALAERYKEFVNISKEMNKQVELEKYYQTLFLEGKVAQKDRASFTEKMNAASTKAAELRAKLNTDDMQMSALYNAMLVKGTDEWLKGLADLVIKADNANASYQELKTSSLEVATALGVAAQNAAALDAARHGQGYTNKAVSMAGVKGTNVSLEGKIDPNIVPGVSVFSGENTYEAYIASKDAAKEYAAALEVLDATAVSASEGFGALGGMISELSGIFGDGAEKWGTFISSIGSAIPQLEVLYNHLVAVAAAQTAVNPWNILSGVAAVGTIIAAIPKFATGGVVPGNMVSGDNVLIRANSGEVVLTKDMAGNIGDALKGGMGGKVVFEIRGDKLVGILRNHNMTSAWAYGNG